MYKRPTPQKRGMSRALPGGELASYPSHVGEIVDKIRNRYVPPAPPKLWVPPRDYEFIAARMENPEPFLKRCRDWFAAHPPKVREQPPVPPTIDQKPIMAVFAKYAQVEGGPKMPPVPELENAWRAAGYPEGRITKALAWHAKMEATTDERQKVLDTIFVKFPSANKPTPKTKPTKVIKVVKKKMPQNNNEQTTLG